MFRAAAFLLFVAVLPGAIIAAVPAEPKAEAKGKTEPAGVPLEARLVAKTETYKLDLGGKTAEEFRKLIEDGKTTFKYPPVPTVDLILEFKNTSEKDLKFVIGPDGAEPMLEIKGTGAATVSLGMNLSGRASVPPKEVTLAAGKTFEWPIKNLKSMSFTREQFQSWWTEPGEYTIVADVHTQVSPVPAGAKDNGKGWAAVKVWSAPVTLKVEK